MAWGKRKKREWKNLRYMGNSGGKKEKKIEFGDIFDIIGILVGLKVNYDKGHGKL